MKPLCIYHANCADGFAAAWVVRGALGRENVEFLAAKYGDAPPDVAGREVYIVDFSYPREQLLAMAAQASRIVVLDHHKTAAVALAAPLPANVQTVFDMEHSGAVLAWRHFHPRKPEPELLLHIQDRDLWLFELEGTREVMAAVMSYPYAFDVWDERLAFAKIDQLVLAGEPLVRQRERDIAAGIKETARRMTIAGYDVPVANLPHYLASDAGHHLAQGEPFAAIYQDTPAGRKFSLRSDDYGIDVSQVAALFGGGGHRGAAGFTVPYTHSLAVGADWQAVSAGHDRLVRELDVLINGEAGAAAQASLCDLVAQVRKEGLIALGDLLGSPKTPTAAEAVAVFARGSARRGHGGRMAGRTFDGIRAVVRWVLAVSPPPMPDIDPVQANRDGGRVSDVERAYNDGWNEHQQALLDAWRHF